MPSECQWEKIKSEGDWDLVNWKPEQRKERGLPNPHQGQISTLEGQLEGLHLSDATHACGRLLESRGQSIQSLVENTTTF